MSRTQGFAPLGGLFFCQKSAFTLLLLLFSSLFLQRFGASGWPWYLTAFPLLFIITQVAVFRGEDWAGKRFLARVLLPLAGASGAFALLGPVPPGWTIFVALVLAKAADLHSTQAFFDLSGRILPLQTAKQLIPRIMALGTVGSIGAGLSMRFLLPLLGFLPFFIGAATLLIIGYRLLRELHPEEPAAAASSTPASVLPESGLLAALSPVARTYCLAVVIISTLGSWALNLTDFQFNGFLAQDFADAASLGAFLGLFNAAMDVTAFLTQGLLGGWIFKQWPLAGILGARPILIGIGAVTAWLVPAFWLVAAVQFLGKTCTSIFMAPSWVLLLEPLALPARRSARRILNSADCVTIMAVGLSLLAWKQVGGGPDPVIFVAVAGVALLTLVGNMAVLRSYPAMIQETLATVHLDGAGEDLEGFRLLPSREREALLQRILAHDRPEVRRRAVREAGKIGGPEESRLLWDAVGREGDLATRTLMVKTLLSLGGGGGIEKMQAFLARCQDTRVQADVLEALGESALGEGSWLVAWFSHPNHRIRGSALLTYLRQAADREHLTRAIEDLLFATANADSRDRSMAAVVLGRLGSAEFLPALCQLAHDPVADVARCAFRALGAQRSPNVIEFLARESQGEGVRATMARQAWEQAANEDRETVARLLSGMTSEERRRAGGWMEALQSGLEPQLLTKVLSLLEPGRSRLLAALADRDPAALSLVQAALGPSAGTSSSAACFGLLERLSVGEAARLADILPALGLSAQPEYLDYLERRVGAIAHELWTAHEARHRHLLTGEDEAWVTAKLDDRILSILTLVAVADASPAECLDALRKARAGDRFQSSVAMELVDEHLTPKLRDLVAPLLTKDEPLERWQDLASRAGFLPVPTLSEADLRGVLATLGTREKQA